MARRCLHGGNVQTASLAAKSQVAAPVTEQEGAQREPAERHPDQDALRVVAVQGQRADREQDSHDNEGGVHSFIDPKDIEDRSAEPVSHEIRNDPAPSDGKTSTLRPRHVGAMHRAHVPWLKRLWADLTRPRKFRVAFLHFRTRRF
jgi:hypothetical protein